MTQQVLVEYASYNSTLEVLYLHLRCPRKEEPVAGCGGHKHHPARQQQHLDTATATGDEKLSMPSCDDRLRVALGMSSQESMEITMLRMPKDA